MEGRPREREMGRTLKRRAPPATCDLASYPGRKKNGLGTRQPAAHAELAAKWRRPVCTGKSSTIYRSSVGQERSDRLVTGHTSVDGGGVQWKNQRLNIFLLGDSGFSEEDEE